MAITIKCPDCGHTQQSDDGAEETCPECGGTMVPPSKKKYQAKSKSLEEESRGKKKPAKVEELPDEDEGDAPKPKKKGGAGDFGRDGGAAAGLELNPGFKNKALMAQVGEELSRTEVLHWAGRMCPEIVEKKAFWARVLGIVFACVGGLFCAVFFATAPWFVGLIPIIFVLVGLGIAAFGPKTMRNQGARGWYAITDQRAIVFEANMFGESGQATTYEPSELRRMRVKAAKSPEGAGDLIFKTKITERRTDYVDRKTGRTVRSETSRQETHYGFLGIEQVREVETLIHKVLLGTIDDEDDE